jgi:hypothetical protein
VTYRVVFTGGAAAQFHELTEDIRDVLVARAVELAEEPWDATVLPPGDDRSLRETTFGDGLGLIGFHVNDDDETVRIFNILWIG